MNPELRARGYLLAKGLLEPTLARVVYGTLLIQQWRGECFRDNHVPTAAAVANSALTDALLLELRPRIEAASGCHLVPTYSYARVYFHGDTFISHCDRGSCEVSVSINVGRDGGGASLYFPPNSRVDMEEGDGAVYLGCETQHSREQFSGNTMAQLFLHYVVAGGPYAEHYFDGYPQRFPPSISRGTDGTREGGRPSGYAPSPPADRPGSRRGRSTKRTRARSMLGSSYVARPTLSYRPGRSVVPNDGPARSRMRPPRASARAGSYDCPCCATASRCRSASKPGGGSGAGFSPATICRMRCSIAGFASGWGRT